MSPLDVPVAWLLLIGPSALIILIFAALYLWDNLTERCNRVKDCHDELMACEEEVSV